MIFITSDLHLNHKNILKYCPHRRDGKDMPEDAGIPDMVDAMNEKIIRNWNSKIAPGDEVYIIGDVAMGLIDKAPALISRLNGIKTLISGNHDVKLVKMCKHREPGFENLFVKIDKMFELSYSYKGTKYPVVMCHFPLMHWDRQNHGAVQLHGHLHSAPDKRFLNEWRQMDVGMDGNDLMPYSMDEIIEIMIKRPVKDVNHHD